MENRINPVLARSHPDFQTLLKQLQNDRILAEKETSQNPIALWKLTKTIANYFLANEKSYKAVVEVDINGVKN